MHAMESEARHQLGVEVSREVLTRLSALAWVEQGARYTYVTGGLRHLSTGTYS